MSIKVKVEVSFLDWQEKGRSIYCTEKGVDLSMGNFHSGSTFNAEIELENEDAEELIEAIHKGYQPCWWTSLPSNDTTSESDT